MRWETIKGVVERVLVAAAMYATGKGWIAPESAAGYVALALGVLQAIWGWYQNTPTVLVKATEAIPTVEKIVVANTAEGRAIESVTTSKVKIE